MFPIPISKGPTIPARKALMALSLFALAGPTARAETVTLSDSAQNAVALRVGGGGVDIPEDPLNCDEAYFPRAGRHCIVQSSAQASPDLKAARRYRAEVYFEAAVLDTSGIINGYHTSGVLHGVEFDWFFPNGTTPPTANRLPEAAEIYGPDPQGNTVLLAKMYCYDAVQYAARKAEVETSIGHVMDFFTIWVDDVCTASGVGGERLQLDGSGNSVFGDSGTNSGARIQGTGNAMIDGVFHVRPVTVHGANSYGWDESVSQVPAVPVPFAEQAARTEAQAFGTYYPGDVTLTASNAPPSGLVFAEGSITLQDPNMSGTWTFVSAAGTISFAGDDPAITAYKDHALAVAYTGDVEVSGTRAVLTGELHAPTGLVAILGSEGRVHGLLAGDRVSVTGTNCVVTDGTDPQ